MLLKTHGLRDLEVHVDTDTSLDKEMEGLLPYKVTNLTFTGLKLKKIADDLLDVRIIFLLPIFYDKIRRFLGYTYADSSRHIQKYKHNENTKRNI